jgi:hypothetical protein
MKHIVPHDLGRQKAKQATEAAFAKYKSKYAGYSPKVRWVKDDTAELSFSIKGLTLAGGVVVRESEIEMDLNVPFLLRPFQKTAIGVIETEIKRWIDKAKAGKL